MVLHLCISHINQLVTFLSKLRFSFSVHIYSTEWDRWAIGTSTVMCFNIWIKIYINVRQQYFSLPFNINWISWAITGSCFYLLSQLWHHFSIYDRIHVLTQHIQDPPISNVRLTWKCCCYFSRNHPVTCVQQVWSYSWYRDYDYSINQQQWQQGCQNDEPKPQKYVCLLIDNVERENT